MRKLALLVIIFLFLSVVKGFAAETSIPYNASMEYEVTVNEVEVFNSTTGQWVTVTNTPVTFNIASATSANTAVGNMITNVTLPNGTYTRLKWEISSTFGIKACAPNGDCTNGTTNTSIGTHVFSGITNGIGYGGAIKTNVTVDFSASCPTNTATVTYTCTATDLAGDTAITPFVIGPGTTPKSVNIAFDVDNVLKHYTANHFGLGVPSANIITPGEPGVSVTFD